MLTLIEQAEQVFDAQQAEATAAKIGSGELTLEDFLEQMMAVRRMGPIGNLLGMLPGAGQMKDALANVDEKQLVRIQAIIRGMTPAERENPKIINASRRLRIANGSGVKVSDVNQLVDRFFEARKMMGRDGRPMGMPGARKQVRGKKGRRARKAARARRSRRSRAASPGCRVVCRQCRAGCRPASRTCRRCPRASISCLRVSTASTCRSSSSPRSRSA